MSWLGKFAAVIMRHIALLMEYCVKYPLMASMSIIALKSPATRQFVQELVYAAPNSTSLVLFRPPVIPAQWTSDEESGSISCCHNVYTHFSFVIACYFILCVSILLFYCFRKINFMSFLLMKMFYNDNLYPL